jgi:hypothetical protein
MEISQKGAASQLLMTTQARVCFRRNCQRNFLHRRNVTKAGAPSSSYANLQNQSCIENRRMIFKAPIRITQSSRLELQRQHLLPHAIALHLPARHAKAIVNACIQPGQGGFVGCGFEAFECAWAPASVVVGVVGKAGVGAEHLRQNCGGCAGLH